LSEDVQRSAVAHVTAGGGTTAPLMLRISADVWELMERTRREQGSDRTRFVSQAIAEHAKALEELHNGGEQWPYTGAIHRAGASRAPGGANLERLQLWIPEALRNRVYAAVNGMKENVDSGFMLRRFIEEAIAGYAYADKQGGG
jgi:hypothetical protein